MELDIWSSVLASDSAEVFELSEWSVKASMPFSALSAGMRECSVSSGLVVVFGSLGMAAEVDCCERCLSRSA